jgi:threonylcarbamoyladenosine tRNA methylthiotransferase MtaB
MGSFYVENFGCRATQADGAALERQFTERGLERAHAPSHAEIVILNTCTVTAGADQDARAAIRRIQRENPGCQIVVTGCYAQRAPAEIAALPGVASVIGNSHKHQLAELALGSELVHQGLLSGHAFRRADQGALESPDLVAGGSSGFVPLENLTNYQRRTTHDVFLTADDRRLTTIHVSDIFAHTELLAAPVFDAANERTRPNLKVQDGCDNRCSFCVIPYVRGQSRSLKLESVIREVQQLVAAGYREVVISGINLGRWGRDLQPVVSSQSPVLRSTVFSNSDFDLFGNAEHGSEKEFSLGKGEPQTTGDVLSTTHDGSLRTDDRRLTTLIRSILDQTDLEKLRISSVEPMDWSDDLIALVANSPRIAKHAHVPMQSGSDRILRAMHRKYRPWHYREKIEKIRAAMPTAAIGADVMVGFPGETDSDFEETRRIVRDLPFTYLHVFTYSARPGTPSASLLNQVPVQVARERNRILRELASEKKLAFMKSFMGKTIQAITLNVFDGKYTEGLTDNYLKLRLGGKHEPNRWIEAHVKDLASGALIGTDG